MGRWTHSTCMECYKKKYPKRTPEQLKRQEGETVVAQACCFCCSETYDGIYTRHDPNELSCRGVHPGDEDL